MAKAGLVGAFQLSAFIPGEGQAVTVVEWVPDIVVGDWIHAAVISGQFILPDGICIFIGDGLLCFFRSCKLSSV